MTDKEIIEVVSAHEAGKKIEYTPKAITDWRPISNPYWDFANHNYRVAKGPKLRPYTFEELRHQVLHGNNIVIEKDSGNVYLITQVTTFGVVVGTNGVTRTLLLESYTWPNGDPCGVYE